MSKGSGTRSGLLWEVERLLNECDELPQVLLMENVPQVHSKKNMPDFQKWIDFLDSKGYSNYWKDLNARDYGVAQNRNRCFMISVLGYQNYKFPEPIPLDKTMKDYLEDKVDDRYYITSEKAKKLIDSLILSGKIPTEQNRTEQNRTEQNRTEQNRTWNALTSQLTSQESSKEQTASWQDMTLESQTCKQTEAVLLSGMSSEKRKPGIKQIDVACTLCARDYKGLNNYGSNGVLECEKIT